MINAEPGGLNTIRFAEKGTLRLIFTVQPKVRMERISIKLKVQLALPHLSSMLS